MMENEKSVGQFWADTIADEVIARAKKEGVMATCRSAASTSGAKHVGNLFDVTKSYIVHKAVLHKGFQSRFLLTHDDRDPLRTVPYRLPTLDAKWVTVEGELEQAIAKYLGYPYVAIPDPFDCCDSWAEHFSKVWEDGISALGIEAEIHSNDALYLKGSFEPYIILALKNIDASRRLIQKFQESKQANYVPFDAICENCGKIIGRAYNFDIESKTIKYVCEGKELAGKYTIEGCGHKGETDFKGGKLPWSFEWPAQWLMARTTFEPFGKEHAEGSWPRCSEICREVYGGSPPIPHIYEFLLIDNEKMSARRGNAYITQEILDIIEPEVFLYFYTKRSKKQRNLDLKNIHMLVADFEHAERVYFNADKENEHEKANMIRMYESSMNKIPDKIPLRIDYQFAAIISEMNPMNSLARAMELLKAGGRVKGKVSGEDEERIITRLQLAKNWAERFAPEGMIIKLNEKVPEEIKDTLTESQKEAVRALAEELKKELTEEQLYEKFYEISKAHGLESKDFFCAVYQLLISRDHGPRLAPFIIAVGKTRTSKILEQA